MTARERKAEVSFTWRGHADLDGRLAERGDGVPNEAMADVMESSPIVRALSEQNCGRGMTQWGVGAECVVELGAKRRPNHTRSRSTVFSPRASDCSSAICHASSI